jgi:hypothetical protein
LEEPYSSSQIEEIANEILKKLPQQRATRITARGREKLPENERIKALVQFETYDENRLLLKGLDSNPAPTTQEPASANIEELRRQLQQLTTQIEEEEKKEEEEIRMAVEQLSVRPKQQGIVDFLFLTYGKRSIQNFQNALQEYLDFGRRASAEGDEQDFYGKTIQDFFQHMQDEIKTFTIFNETDRYEYYINEEQYYNDRRVYESVVENLEQFDEVMDLQNLNAQQNISNWHTITRFALYEKYNYFLPTMHKYLNSSQWKMISDAGEFNDFVYSFCTIFSLIFNNNAT